MTRSVLLRRISRAIGLPVTSWCMKAPSHRLTSCCCRSSSSGFRRRRLAKRATSLLRHFGEPSDNARRQRIALIGLRGGGSPHSAKLAAERLRVPASSNLIARSRSAAAPRLSEIFDMFGQRHSAVPNAKRSTRCYASTRAL